MQSKIMSLRDTLTSLPQAPVGNPHLSEIYPSTSMCDSSLRWTTCNWEEIRDLVSVDVSGQSNVCAV
jgi:hypothetical protein